MNKHIVTLLLRHNWTQAKIARRLKVDRSLVCRFFNLIGRSSKTRCEICGKLIDKKQYIKVKDVKPFLVCDDCKNEF